MTVNTNAWKKFPLAARELPFNFDEAVPRIMQWAAGDTAKFNTAFLWRNAQAPANNRNSYRLPVIDIVNGKATLIPHAVQSAARILSGAHGQLEGVVSEEEIDQLKSVVTNIYQVFQETWGDPRVKPPWLLGGNEEGKAVPASAGPDELDTLEAVAASVAPVAPPKEWFSDPNLDGPTPLEVTADGRVFGHLATFGKCHVGRKGCVTAPKSSSGYKYFANGKVLTADGTPVNVGRITMDTMHPDGYLGYTDTFDFYANTGMQVATVAVGEDSFGVWVAGSLVPEATPEHAARLRRSPLSGDWRPINGRYELTAALAVNSPGFPIVASAGDGEGAILSAGMIDHTHPDEECAPCENLGKFTVASAAFDEKLTQMEQSRRAARLAALKE